MAKAFNELDFDCLFVFPSFAVLVIIVLMWTPLELEHLNSLQTHLYNITKQTKL